MNVDPTLRKVEYQIQLMIIAEIYYIRQDVLISQICDDVLQIRGIKTCCQSFSNQIIRPISIRIKTIVALAAKSIIYLISNLTYKDNNYL